MPDVSYGEGTSEYGPGVTIKLSRDEIATAIDAYLVAHNIAVVGPRTITSNGVYVDPSGFVIDQYGEKFSGAGSDNVGAGHGPVAGGGGQDLATDHPAVDRPHLPIDGEGARSLPDKDRRKAARGKFRARPRMRFTSINGKIVVEFDAKDQATVFALLAQLSG